MRFTTSIVLLIFAFFMGIIVTMDDFESIEDEKKSLEKLQATVSSVAVKASKIEKKEVVEKVRKIVNEIKEEYEKSDLNNLNKELFVEENIKKISEELDSNISDEISIKNVKETDTFNTMEKELKIEDQEIEKESKKVIKSLKKAK
ncbi:MAG: hypothetical protein HRS57_02510 [Mycoplasmataceae bacterium]|nr:hypothetical protein [Mycoplasmataceae bacterium]